MNLNQPKIQERSFLTAYPNPSSDITYLTTEIPNGVEIVTIEIIDALGRNSNQLLQVNPIGVIELDVKNLETGIYLCKMYFDGIHVESEKVIVLH